MVSRYVGDDDADLMFVQTTTAPPERIWCCGTEAAVSTNAST